MRVFILEVGDQQPDRRGDARLDRDDDVLGEDRLGERHRMQRSGAAEPHQREVARIDALGHRIGVDRQRHVVVDDPEDAERGRLERQAERPGDVLADRFVRQRRVDRQVAAEEMLGIHAPEHHLGVGDRRLVAALGIAGGAGHRAGRARADAEGAAGIDIGDRSAAGADRVDVDHRHQHRQVGDFGVARVLDPESAPSR